MKTMSSLKTLATLLLAVGFLSISNLTMGVTFPNNSYPAGDLYKRLTKIDNSTGTSEGHGFVAVHQGYLMVPFSANSGGGVRDNGDETGGFAFIDVTDPENPITVFTTDGQAGYKDQGHPNYARNIRESHGSSISENIWCMTFNDEKDNRSGVQFWDISNVLSPQKLSEIELPDLDGGDYDDTAWWVCWQGRYAYVAGCEEGLYVVDALDPSNPVIVNTESPGGPFTDRVPTGSLGNFRVNVVLVCGNLLMLGKDGGGLGTYDIGNPNKYPIEITANNTDDSGYSFMFNGGRIYAANNPPIVFYINEDPNDAVTDGAITGSDTGPVDISDKGGYAVIQDDRWYYGSSEDGVIMQLSSLPNLDDYVTLNATGFNNPDWDFVQPLGNLIWLGNDRQPESALLVGALAPDTTPPAVNYVNPVHNAVNQALTSRIGITLTDQLQTDTITTSTFIVRPKGGSAIPGRYSYQTGIINFWPDNPLAVDTEYEVEIVAGGMKDIAGNGVTAFISRFTTGDAFGVEVEATEPGIRETGQSIQFVATPTNADSPEYQWDFGDGFVTPFSSDNDTYSYTYDDPGHYSVTVYMQDGVDQASDTFSQLVHRPLTALAPTNSSTIVHDAANGRVWNVNPDNDTVTAISDISPFGKIIEVPVGDNPRTLAVSPNNEIWVTCQGDDKIVRIDASAGTVIGGVGSDIDFDYGASPYGVVFSPDTLKAYVTLEGSGHLVKIDSLTRVIDATLPVGNKPRGIAVAADSSRVLVTRFVSPDTSGEILDITAATLSLTDTIALTMDATPDTEDNGRGLPNYISSIAISPDGTDCWVPSKKDNSERGEFLEGGAFVPGDGFQNTVRSIVSKIDLGSGVGDGSENGAARVDFNDRGLASSIAFTQLGNYALVTTQGSQFVEVIDNYSNNFEISITIPTGRAPQGLALSGDGNSLFVHNYMSRSVTIFDITTLASGDGLGVPDPESTDTVSAEALPADVLAGKQLFYNALDARMNQDGYISCATCHLDGGSDGRTWDFTDRGEGLRNTIDLRGRGVGHGPVHWTANFDEIQDFEHDMRGPFGGDGFMEDDDFNTGTRNQSLGDPKVGVSVDLDNLAAYVASLTTVGKSPHRSTDGSLTADGKAGQAIFADLYCSACHGGAAFTDSASLARYDVGTITAGSGQRLGGTLDGFDTPTVRGLWRTGPYLHDGSAETVLDVFGLGLHANYVSALDASQKNQLVDYLLQIDDTDSIAPLGGDFDSDGDADGDDLDQWKTDYGTTVDEKIVDGSDFLRWQQKFTGEKIAVPNVVNLAELDANNAITGLGLVMGSTTQANHVSLAAGVVISSSPAFGASLSPGGAVSIVVSLGPAPVNVPGVVGLTQSAASSAITGAGLTVGTVTPVNSGSVPAGDVISSDPIAGTSVPFGSSVDLVVSLGPAFTAIYINFQIDTAPYPVVGFPAYLEDTGLIYGARGNGQTYGWVGAANGETRVRGVDADQRKDTLNHMQKNGDTTWEIALPNGDYTFTVLMGDPANTDQTNHVMIEGTIVSDPDGQDNFDLYTNLVRTVNDGDLTFTSVGAGGTNAKICYLDITGYAAAAPLAASSAAGTELPPAMLSASGVVPTSNHAPTVPAPAEADSSTSGSSPLGFALSAESKPTRPMRAVTAGGTDLRLLILKAKLRKAATEVRQGRTRRAQRRLDEIVDELSEMLTDTIEGDRKTRRIKQLLGSATTLQAKIAAEDSLE